jgi:hypothetical protein
MTAMIIAVGFLAVTVTRANNRGRLIVRVARKRSDG